MAQRKKDCSSCRYAYMDRCLTEQWDTDEMGRKRRKITFAEGIKGGLEHTFRFYCRGKEYVPKFNALEAAHDGGYITGSEK